MGFALQSQLRGRNYKYEIPLQTKNFPILKKNLLLAIKLGNCLVKKTKIRPDISPKTSPTNPDLKPHNNLTPPLRKIKNETKKMVQKCLTIDVSCEQHLFSSNVSQKLQITEKSGQKVENAFRRLKLTQNHPKPTK